MKVFILILRVGIKIQVIQPQIQQVLFLLLI